MKRIKSKTLVIILLVIIVIGLTLIIKKGQDKGSTVIKQETSNSPTNTSAAPKTYSLPAGEFFEKDGLPKNLPENSEVVSQTGNVIIFDSNKYRIMYYGSRDQYAIYIYESPFDVIIVEAEDKFLETLNISKNDACTIDVLITTPEFANPKEAGKNYYLSFCEKND